MAAIAQIDKVRILLDGIEQWGNGIKLTVVKEEKNNQCLTILPSINGAGTNSENIEYIRNLILNRLAINSLEAVSLQIFGNNSTGYKIVAAVNPH